MAESSPANNPEAEKAVLGCMLGGPQYVREGRLALRSEDFYTTAHQLTFAAIVDVAGESLSGDCDVLMVTDRLRKKGKLADAGGPTAIMELGQGVATWNLIQDYIRIVKAAAIEREIERQFARAAQEKSRENIALLGELIQKSQGINGGQLFDFRTDLMGVLPALLGGSTPGMESGYEAIDHHFNGFDPGDLTVIAARTSGGKTAIMTKMAVQMAEISREKHLKPICFTTTEMTREQMIYRILPLATRIPLFRYRLRTLSVTERNAVLATAQRNLATLPLIINAKSRPSLDDVRAATIKSGCRVHFVDYLQRCAMPKAQNRTYEVQEFMCGLKTFSQDVMVHSFLGCQLDRNLDKEPRAPVLADCKDSGSIEAEADNVILMWRPQGKLANKGAPVTSGHVEIQGIIGKGRNAGAGKIIELELNGELVDICEREWARGSKPRSQQEEKKQPELINGKEVIEPWNELGY